MTGSLCGPLCDSKEIRFKKCLGHGGKLHVLEAEWNGDIIVLKTPKPVGTSLVSAILQSLVPKDMKKEDFMLPAEKFIFHVSRLL